MRVLLATRSVHKAEEVRRILADAAAPVSLLDLDEAGIPESPEEDGLEPHETFEENALSKARWFHARSGLPTIADDSGLEVDALGGRPGVRTKRFAPDPPDGPPLDGRRRDLANNAHLLMSMRDVAAETRAARFVCVAALVTEAGERIFRGEARGEIAEEPSGRGGFGYDPVFYDPELQRTFAEIDADEKHARSHRGRAFRALAAYLAGNR